MGQHSKIEWCDATFNGWIGCTKVSPACTNCYAERDMAHRRGVVGWGPGEPRVMTTEDYWRGPEKWARKAHAEGKRLRVFAFSLSDVFDAENTQVVSFTGKRPLWWRDGVVGGTAVPDGGPNPCAVVLWDLRIKLFRLIARTAYALDWLLLTKRSAVMKAEWPRLERVWVDEVLSPACLADPRLDAARKFYARRKEVPNVWAGVTVENQRAANERIGDLLSVPVPVSFVSCEPLVGPVDLRKVIPKGHDGTLDAVGGWLKHDLFYPMGRQTLRKVNWVITGGETGPGCRPADLDWYRSLREQADAAHVPFLFKQHGEFGPADDAAVACHVAKQDAPTLVTLGTSRLAKVPKHVAGRVLDGGTHDGVPVVDWGA